MIGSDDRSQESSDDARGKPAFDEFFRIHFPRLVNLVMQYGGCFDEAEDAAELAAVEVLQRWDELRNPVAYASRVAITNFTSARRRDGERLRRSIVAGRLSREDHHYDAVEDREEQDWVVDRLAGLSPAQCQVMAFTFDGFSPAEVASIVGKSPATVRANLMLARRRLADMLRTGKDESSAGPANGREADE